MAGLVNKRIEMDIGSMEFIKAFDNISHNIITDELMKSELDKWA